jgi:hypothetical protein
MTRCTLWTSWVGVGAGDGQLCCPVGLRFSGDGSAVCVADSWNSRATVFRAGDGVLVRHVASGLRVPLGVEEVEGGWLVVCRSSHRVEFADGEYTSVDPRRRPALGGRGTKAGKLMDPVAMAIIPGLGLVVRELGNRRLQLFATPDAFAMAAMSRMRVAWMAAVMRGAARRASAL